MRAVTGASVDLTHAEFDAVRKLLENQQTWTLLGRGTVEDLADRIGDCLPSRDGRTAEDSHAAALTIARGPGRHLPAHGTVVPRPRRRAARHVVAS